MKSNDGTMIPSTNFDRSMVDAGPLGRNTMYSNEMAFEHSPNKNNAAISGMQSWRQNENLDDPGFEANAGSSFFKFGTPYGEAAMFNQLPPGPDITDQNYAIFNNMPMRTYSGGTSYPGDTPWPMRDIPE